MIHQCALRLVYRKNITGICPRTLRSFCAEKKTCKGPQIDQFCLGSLCFGTVVVVATAPNSHLLVPMHVRHHHERHRSSGKMVCWGTVNADAHSLSQNNGPCIDGHQVDFPFSLHGNKIPRCIPISHLGNKTPTRGRPISNTGKKLKKGPPFFIFRSA